MEELFNIVVEEFVRIWHGLVVAEVIDEVRTCRFVEVRGGLERSFTGSDVAAEFRTDVDRA